MKRRLFFFIFLEVFFLPEISSAGNLSDSGIGLPAFGQSTVAWGDIDNDGDLDLAICGETIYTPARRSIICINYGDHFTPIWGALEGVRSGSLSWGDYDRDGDLDLALSGYVGDNIGFTTIYENSKGGLSFTDSGIEIQPVCYSSLAWGDYDNDGDLDLALTGYSEGYYAKIFRNKGNGRFEDTGITNLTPVASGSLAWGDYNNDGFLDLVVAGHTEKKGEHICKVYKNNHGKTFTEVQDLEGISDGCVAWADYDNDGYLDLAICGRNIANIYHNDGPPNYTLSLTASLGEFSNASLSWGDYDNDGDLDLGIAGCVGTYTVTGIYRNSGSPNYQFSLDTSQDLIGVELGSVSWADYDNDGDLDFLITGSSGTEKITLLYENDEAGSNPNNPPSPPTNLNAEYSGGKLYLKWAPGSDDKTPTSGLYYNLRIGTTPYQNPGDDNLIAGSYGSPLLGNYLRTKVSDTQLGHTIEKIPEGYWYWWSVQSIDTSFSASPWAGEEEVYCEPTPPCGISNLTALPGAKDGEISLSWTAPGDDGTLGACEWYLVKYATAQITADLFAGASTYFQDWFPQEGMTAEGPKILTGFTPGTTYYFALRAWDGCVYSPWSTDGVNKANWAPAQDLVPQPPQNLTCIPGDSAINLSWAASPEPDIKHYHIWRDSVPPADSFIFLTSVLFPQTTYQDTGLTNYNTYYYLIKAEDYTNHISTESNITGTFPRDLIPPAAITDLTGYTSENAGQIDLSWTAPGDDGWEGYIASGLWRIAYSTISDFGFRISDFQVEIPTSCSPMTGHRTPITGLIGDTTYFLCIWTADETSNWSAESNIAYAKTRDTVPPAAIMDLSSLTGEKAGDIVLSWTAPGDNEWSGNIINGLWRIAYSTNPAYPFSVSDYQVEITTSCSPFTSHSYIFTAPSYAEGGLHAGVTHYFRIWTGDEVPNWSEESIPAFAYAQYDTTEPVSGVEVPINGERYSALSEISGTADDEYSGVDYVEIAIQYLQEGTTYYWDDSDCDWKPIYSVLLASGVCPWKYVFRGTWSTGREYIINSWATDIGYYLHRQGDGPQYYAPGESRFVFDNLPPQAITNLSALTGGQGGEIKLCWTAPRDQPLGGGGLASVYIIRYATFSIADLGGNMTAWWDSALNVGNELSPSAPGNFEELIIGGLEHGVTYWFAIKSEDNAIPPNVSKIDNLATSGAQANAVARYADEATFFKVSGVLDPITAGVRSNFTVEPYNPHQSATGYRGTVEFSSDDGKAVLPGNYTFTSADITENHISRSFIGGVIFKTPGERYVLVRDTTIPTIDGQQSGITVKAKYTDIVDHNGKEIILPDGVPEDGNMKINFPKGALTGKTTIFISVDETGKGYQDPENKYIDFPVFLASRKPVAGYQISASPENTLTGEKPITLTLLYPDINPVDGKVDGTTIDEENLRCFWWDGCHWRYLGGKVNTTENVVTAKTNKLGLFALFPVKGKYASLSLKDTKPKRKIITPFGDNPVAEFVGLAEPFKITIFDFTGQVVREIEEYPACWDGKDESNRVVESGIYIYKIQKDGEEVTGTIVVAK